MHVEFRTDDDNRTGGVVDTLTEQVLTEAALLTLQGVGQGLEGPVGLALDGGGLLGVVEQGVDGLLQHALLVAENHFRSLDLDELLEAVVPDDDAAVQVVEVGGGEAAAVQRDERTELRRSHGEDLHDHPLGTVDVLGLLEPLHDGKALEDIGLALLGSLGAHLLAQGLAQSLDVDLLQQVIDALGTHLGDELLGIAFRKGVVLGEAVHHGEVLVLGEEVVLLVLAHTRVDDDVLLVVDDGLELLRGDAEQGADLVRSALEVPDVGHRNGQGDMAHALAADFLLRHLDTAAVADDTAVADPLVLAAVALVILGRTEDLLAEETVTLGLVGPVVDRFRLQDLAAGPFGDVLRRGEGDGNLREVRLHLAFLVVICRHIL